MLHWITHQTNSDIRERPKLQNKWTARIQTKSEIHLERMENDCLSYFTGTERKTIFRFIKTGF
jgi:hypothetical protein